MKQTDIRHGPEVTKGWFVPLYELTIITVYF